MARRSTLTLLVCLVAGLAPVVSLGDERWTRPARGLMYLHRIARLADGHAMEIHAVLVDLGAPGVTLRATAPEEGGQTVSRWATRVGAAVAVNGDYFQGTPLHPLGPARGDGHPWPVQSDAFYDGLLAAGAGRAVTLFEHPLSAGATVVPVDPGYTEVLSVHERLVIDGRVRLNPLLHHDGRRHPRTALGLTRDGHTLIVLVVDGRSESSDGASAMELGHTLIDLGAYQGMKLDGGGSSTMFIRGRGVVNHPSDGAERTVASHVGVLIRDATDPHATPSRAGR